MALPLQILEDSTDTLYDELPVEGTFGNVASQTVRVQTPAVSPGEVEAATLETTSYTLAAAVQGASSIAWTAAAGTAPEGGRRYAIGKAAGATPFPVDVDVERVDVAASTIHLRTPLVRDVEAGDVMKGLRLTHALTAAETDEKGQASAIWSVTLTTPYQGRSVIAWEQYFRVVPQFFYHGLTDGEAVRLVPELRRHTAGAERSLQDAIEAAWEAVLLEDLQGQRIDIWSIKSAWQLRPVLAFATLHHVTAADESLDERTREAFRVRYQDRLRVVLESKELWIDTGDTGALPGETPPRRTHGVLRR